MSNHTPGPMIVEVVCDCVCVRDANGDVCLMANYGNKSPADVLALAHMFAAAPRMKVAIEMIVNWLDDDNAGMREFYAHEQELRAALAEANGEAPDGK